MSQRFLLIICFFITTTAWSLNRINRPTDPAKRCMSRGTSTTRCEDMRQNALRINCITKEEYQTLKKYGSYPTCNLLRGEGLDMLDGWCACGCFHPQTKLTVIDKYSTEKMEKTIRDILTQKNHLYLVHLNAHATLSDFSKHHSLIRLTTKGEEQRHLIKLTTNTNNMLMVTPTHPILTSTGIMKQARSLLKTDRLLDQDGQVLYIQEIKTIHYQQSVMNLATEAKHNNEHIIFANNIAVGDLFWQASLEDLFNQIQIRG